MNSIQFIKLEVAAAVARGVRQCVMIGSYPALGEAIGSAPDQKLQVFAVEDESKALAAALENSNFDRLKASLFFWLGGAGYRTVDAVMTSLAFIGSLPTGSGVVLDYAVERTSCGSFTHTALDALASRITTAGSSVKHLIQPLAVAALLRGFGFQEIVDFAEDELQLGGGHLVSALV